MACFDYIKNTVLLFIIQRFGNRDFLHYLADLFKLFILLNYVYFAYMIFSHLFYILNNMFESRKSATYSDHSRIRSESRRDSRDRRHPPCTCIRSKDKSPGKECSKSASICNIFPKSKSGRSKSGDHLATARASSSIDRIKVDFEFNCKPKKSKRNRDGREERMMKSRSCTKCGKNLSERSSKCNNRSGGRRRRGHCGEYEEEFGLRR